MREYDQIVIERVNKNNCPICCKSIKDGEISFVDHNGTKQPVHSRHIMIQDKDQDGKTN